MAMDASAQSGQLIQCRVCGKWMSIVHPNHLKKHRLTAEQYKKQYGVDFLVAPKVRERAVVNRSNGGYGYIARSREEIMEALQAHAKIHSPLSHTHLKKLDPTLVRQAIRTFGSWGDALKAARLRRCPRKEWSKEKILEILKKRKEAGDPMNAAEIQKSDSRLYAAVLRYFGDMEIPLKRIGVDYAGVTKRRARDDHTYRRDLLKWCAKHGPLSPKAVIQTDSQLYEIARLKHGSLRNAARKFGLPYNGERTRWTKERVAEELRDFHRRNGPLQDKTLQDENLALYMATRRYFGSLRKATTELLLPFTLGFKTWTDEQVLRELRLRAEERRSLALQIVVKEDGPLIKAASRYFGSWVKAKEAAGVN